MSNLDLPQEEFGFVRDLLQANGRFLVIGGYATKFYGCRKSVKDLDILIDNSIENVRIIYPVIVKSLDYLGHNPAFKESDLSLLRKQLKFPGEKIDIITSSDRVNFDEAWDRRERSFESGILIPIVPIKDLIEIKNEAIAKDLSRREKELVDIACLEKVQAA